MDYSGHRMNDYEWISQYMDQLGKDKLFEFIDAVYKGFEHMNPGKSINLKTATGITDKNRDLYIKVACLYISEGHTEMEFSNDYTILKKYEYKANCDKKKMEKIGN